MNARIRLLKEARQLQWAWLLVLAAALISIAPKYSGPYWMMHLTETAFMLGAFVGVPLLASLPLGYEFENHSFALLLAQPIDRRRIWNEKYLVTLAAVVPPALMFWLADRTSHSADPNFPPTILVAWMLGMCAAAPFWTMVAKSTLGGLVLDSAFHILLIAAVIRERSDRLLTTSPLSITAYLAYIIAIGWLGRAFFLRQQAIEGWASEDPLSSAFGRVLPRFLLSFLHSRADTPSLNLVRRELWLLRPVWVVGLFNVLIWSGLVVFHQVPAVGSHKEPSVVMMFAILLLPITAVLAGALSLGEEKNWGTHGWHLTLPIPVAKQWAIKLTVSAVTSIVCASLFPLFVLVGCGKLSADTSTYVPHELLWAWPLTMGCIAVAAFWCSCIVKGTVKAVLSLLAVCVGSAFAGATGFSLADFAGRIAQGWMQSLFIHFSPFREPSWVHLLRFATPQWYLLLLVAVVGVQSFRLFRERRPDSKRNIVFAMFPPMLLTFCAVFGPGIAFGYLMGARRAQDTVFSEIHTAIESTIPPNPAQPLVLTSDQLGKAAPLSNLTRAWLASNAIRVHPNEQLSLQNWRPQYFSPVGGLGISNIVQPYVAELRLRDGMQCKLSYLQTPTLHALAAECH